MTIQQQLQVVHLLLPGSSGMVQAITANDNKSTLNLYFTETQKANTLISITDESGKLICAYNLQKDFQKYSYFK